MLIPTSDFIGLEGKVHLCAGGETPMLKTQMDTVQRFFEDKVWGEECRDRQDATSQSCKEKVAQLFHVNPEDLAFLSSSTEGVNLLAYALPWEPGDNVVVADVEFPSDVLPWTRLENQGVEVRIVENQKWEIITLSTDSVVCKHWPV